MTLLRRIGHPDQELELFDAVFSLGNHEDDDIFFQEEGVASAHVSFISVGDSVILQGAKSVVYLNGQMVHAYPCPWAKDEVLSLSEDVHLYLGEEEPEVPTLEKPKSIAPVVKPSFSLSDLKAYLPVLYGFVGVLLVVTAINVWTSPATVQPIDYEPPMAQQLSSSQTKVYFEKILGENLLSYEEDDDTIRVRILIASPEQLSRWAEDIDRVMPKIGKNVVIDLINPTETVKNAKAELLAKFPNRAWDVDGMTLTLKGACLPADCVALRRQLANTQIKDVELKDGLFEVKTAGITILSVTVSDKHAQATLSRNGVVVVVPERGQVFDIGTLRLIRQDGIEISTAHGTIFMPWRQS